MKTVIVIVLMSLGLNGLAQNGWAVADQKINISTEIPGGIISGQIRTTDGKPAAYVTIYVKENNKTAITDEHGDFVIRNLKDGVYTLEITMVGLKPQQKTVVVKNEETSTVAIVLTEDEKQLTEVVIATGRRLNNKPVAIGKVDINPMDLPQSLTVVGQGLIRDQQAQRLSDVTKNVNGIYMVDVRGNAQERFGARGYAFGNYNLFKNGFRINSGVMPEISSIERVEVLKGSAAILFGQVAPGGILNMVTKEPKFNFGGEVSMRLGSYNLYKPAFDIYGPVSSSIAYRLNGTFESSGSYRDNVSSQKYYVNPSLLFKLGKKTELVAEGDYLYNDYTPDFGIGTLGGAKIPNLPRNRFLGTNWQYNKIQQSTVTLSVKHQFNEAWKMSSSLSYQNYDRDYFSVERIQADTAGDWARPLGRVLSNEKYYAAQVNINGRFTTAAVEHILLAGTDADHFDALSNGYSFPAVAGLPANSYDKINILDPKKFTPRTDIPSATNTARTTTPTNRFGIYVQDLAKISPKFNLLAGIRWSYVETKGARTTNLSTGMKTAANNRYDQAFSPRFGVVYKPAKTTSVFASYSNSFVVNSGLDIDSNSLKPSIIDQYELGVKNEFFNGLLSANVTLYRIVNNNLAQTAPFLKNGLPNNSTTIKQLTGQTTSDGIEVDFASHPIKGLDISAGYSYNFMRYTKTDTTLGSFKEGERLVNNPAHTANAIVFYTFRKGFLTGLKTGATVVYLGDRFGGWNTDVISVNPAKYRTRLIPVEGYTTIDLSAGYSYKKVSIMAKVSNLTNTLNYYVHENYSINPIPPTQFVATVSYKF